MRLVEKRAEPATLADVRRATTTDLSTNDRARTAYDQLDKQSVREALAGEQGWLCAFCMRRIDPKQLDDRGDPTMKIAHRTPVAVEPGLALTWRNLLGSCDGGQRSSGHHWTCDAAQGDAALSVDPTQRASMAKITYARRDGRAGLFLASTDADHQRDIDSTLRLNSGDLPATRDSVRRAFQDRCRREGQKGVYGHAAWQGFFAKWLGSHTRPPEFLGAVEALLQPRPR